MELPLWVRKTYTEPGALWSTTPHPQKNRPPWGRSEGERQQACILREESCKGFYREKVQAWCALLVKKSRICHIYLCVCFLWMFLRQPISHSVVPQLYTLFLSYSHAMAVCGRLPRPLRPPQSCAAFSIPRGPRSSSLASAHRVYVLCNCRPQSEQEASVCQNRHVFPSSKA